jgi:hypothetical protein
MWRRAASARVQQPAGVVVGERRKRSGRSATRRLLAVPLAPLLAAGII